MSDSTDAAEYSLNNYLKKWVWLLQKFLLCL